MASLIKGEAGVLKLEEISLIFLVFWKGKIVFISSFLSLALTDKVIKGEDLFFVNLVTGVKVGLWVCFWGLSR